MDSNKINLILNSIEENIYFEREGKKDELNKLNKISNDIKYFYGEIKSKILIARIEYLEHNYEKALSILKNSKIKVSNNKDITLKLEIYKEIGMLYYYEKNYRLSLEYYLKALSKSIKYKETKNRWKILNNIGVLFNEIGDFELAKERYLQALSTYNTCDNKINKILLINIGEVYKNLEEYNIANNYYDIAKEEINFSIYEDSHFLKIVVNLSLAEIYYKIGDVNKAFKKYEYWINILINSNNYSLYPKFLLSYCKFILDYKNEFNYKYLKLGLKYSQINLEYSIEAEFMILLGKYYENKDLKKSNEYYKENIKINNNIIKKLNKEKIQVFKKYQIIRDKDDRYNKLVKNIKRIEKISQIGLEFMKYLSLEKIYNLTYEMFSIGIEFDKLGIGLYNENSNTIKYDFFVIENERVIIPEIQISYGKNLASYVLRKRTPIRINCYSKEWKNYIKVNNKSTSRITQESIIYIPIYFDHKIIGTITIQSKEPFAFSKEDFNYINALSLYITVALNNALEKRKLEELNRKLNNKTQRDFSTNLYNKRGFNEIAKTEIARAVRNKSSIAIIILDIDYFKEYNDYYGHVKGDKILKQFADILQKVFKRSIDFVSRFGGDEFVAILSNMTEKGLNVILDKLISEINNINIKHNKSPYGRITSSIGAVLNYPKREVSLEYLLNEADKALYRVKNNDKNDFNVINLYEEVN